MGLNKSSKCAHFTVISTEHDWSENSEQYEWINRDLGSVNRLITPWVVFTGHRPMYTTIKGRFALRSVNRDFVKAIEPLLVQNKGESWSLPRISEFGYLRVHATREDMRMELVNSNTRQVEVLEDRFRITKMHGS